MIYDFEYSTIEIFLKPVLHVCSFVSKISITFTFILYIEHSDGFFVMTAKKEQKGNNIIIWLLNNIKKCFAEQNDML